MSGSSNTALYYQFIPLVKILNNFPGKGGESGFHGKFMKLPNKPRPFVSMGLWKKVKYAHSYLLN